MAVYKTRWFDRWAKKQGLTTQGLCTAIRELTKGLYEADRRRLIQEAHRTAWAGQEWRVSLADRHQHGKPMGVCVRLSKERA